VPPWHRFRTPRGRRCSRRSAPTCGRAGSKRVASTATAGHRRRPGHQPTATYRNAWRRAKISTQVVQVPGIARQRVSYPAIGSEVLWPAVRPTRRRRSPSRVDARIRGRGAHGDAWQVRIRPPFGGTPDQPGQHRLRPAARRLQLPQRRRPPSTGEDLVGAAAAYPLPTGTAASWRRAAVPGVPQVQPPRLRLGDEHGIPQRRHPLPPMISCGFRYDAPARA